MVSIETYADLIQHIKFMIEISKFDLVGAFADELYRRIDLDEDDDQETRKTYKR